MEGTPVDHVPRCVAGHVPALLVLLVGDTRALVEARPDAVRRLLLFLLRLRRHLVDPRRSTGARRLRGPACPEDRQVFHQVFLLATHDDAALHRPVAAPEMSPRLRQGTAPWTPEVLCLRPALLRRPRQCCLPVHTM